MSDGRMTVLLAGFGGPESLDQVPAFVESVLGRVPPEHVIPAALERYRTIGGGSPLPGTTRRQAKLLGEELGRRGLDAEVHVGMLHATPTIDETADRIGESGSDDVYVLSLAPYRCEVSTDAFEAAVSRAFEGGLEVCSLAPTGMLTPHMSPPWPTCSATPWPPPPGHAGDLCGTQPSRRMVSRATPTRINWLRPRRRWR